MSAITSLYRDIEFEACQTLIHIPLEWFHVSPNLANSSTIEPAKQFSDGSLTELNEPSGDVAMVRKAIMSRVSDPTSPVEIVNHSITNALNDNQHRRF